MWKKILLSFILIVIILAGLYGLKYHTAGSGSQAVSVASPVDFEEQVFTYNRDNLSPECTIGSKMACAVDFAVKCTLNPDFNGCRQSKLPKFIFMDDESLDRPTEMSFQISKIKPISADLFEIYTQSSCNGNWFGLCEGKVIYVLVPDNENWRVKDIYAVEK